MNAYVSIRTGNGQETLSVHVDDHDPFVILTMKGTEVYLTREDARRTADALRAAALRSEFDTGFTAHGRRESPEVPQ